MVTRSTSFSCCSSSHSSSSHQIKKSISLHTMPWLQTLIFFFLFSAFSLNSVSSSASEISYADHCASIIPESPPNVAEHVTHRLQSYTGYYSGGSKILNQNLSWNSNSLSFDARKVSKTGVEGVFRAKGSLTLQSTNVFNQVGNSSYSYTQSYYNGGGISYQISSVSFKLHGYWSESSGKLCMVGSGSTKSKDGNSLDLAAVLKLNNFKNSTNVTTLVGGTLESLNSANDATYFEPISMMLFPQTNYKYSLVPEEFDSKEFDKGLSGGSDFPPGLPIDSNSRNSLCYIFSDSVNGYELNYESDCNSSKNCSPFGGIVKYLPRLMSLNSIQCSSNEERMQIQLEFGNSSYYRYYRPFNPDTSLVGEALWDENTNQLCVFACRILNTADSWANAYIGDCSIRLSLRIQEIWSIRDTSSIVGQIWSNRTVNDPGYFEKIKFRRPDGRMLGLEGLKYKYTVTDRAMKSCPKSDPAKSKGKTYPSAYSYDMRFHTSVKSAKQIIAWGNSDPISVGDLIYEQYLYPVSESFAVGPNVSDTSPLNVSYKMGITLFPDAELGSGISLFNKSSKSNERFEISAEGIYDGKTGLLCMVGCRSLGLNNQSLTNDSMDCEILVNFQFPPLNNNGEYIKGIINSTRGKSDPLYFDQLDLSANAFYTVEARESIWRMDMEIVMALIANTLACVFVLQQLFYVKKQRDVLPSMSLVMLVILTLGHMIPLLLNFEALFLQKHSRLWRRRNVFLGTGGWLEVKEVIVRVVTMIAFLLESRLLQQTWTARLGEGNQKGLWVAEKNVLYASLPLYLAGALIALHVNWRKNKHDLVMHSSHFFGHQQHSLWGGLKSYGGLVLDGFLLPQILLNIFWNSRENALSGSFYIGTTLVRLLPHVYDLYRGHGGYVPHYDMSYIYADPAADFYSTAWDVIIPLGGLLFAVIIYLQQRFGGRCILPRRLRDLEAYEKVPMVSEAQLPEVSST